MWLKNSHSCNSCQSGGFLTQPNRGVLRKSLLSTEVKEGIRYFCRTCFTHTDTLSQFLLHSSCQMQLLQTWPCTGTQRIMLVMLMPHLTLWEYFYPCSLDYFLPVYLIFSLWLLQQSNGIWATPRTVHSCSFSPGQCQGFDLPGQHFFFS